MKTIFKLIACWAAFAVSFPLYAIVLRIFHLKPVAPPDSHPLSVQLLATLAGGAVLVLGMWPLARRTAAPFKIRALAFAGFLFLVLGINGTLEARFFTNLLNGSMRSAVVFYLVQAALVGTLLGWCFGLDEKPSPLPVHGRISWIARVAAAWLAWPVIYFFFGMCISPIIMPYYRAGVAGLHIPPLSTVILLQLFRSAVFLAATLPLVKLWKGSRRGLWFALGLTHVVVVGLHQMVGSTFLPPVLRITHGVEMTADAFAYVGLLVLLFSVPAPSKATALLPDQPHPQPL